MALHGRFCAQIGHFRDGPMWVNGKTGDRWKKSLRYGMRLGDPRWCAKWLAHTAVAATRSACSGATLWPFKKGPSGAGRSSISEYRAVAGRVCCSRNKSKHSTHTPARLQLLLVVIPPGMGRTPSAVSTRVSHISIYR